MLVCIAGIPDRGRPDRHDAICEDYIMILFDRARQNAAALKRLGAKALDEARQVGRSASLCDILILPTAMMSSGNTPTVGGRD